MEQPNKNRSSIKIAETLLVRIEDWQYEEKKKTGRRPSVKELIERAWEHYTASESKGDRSKRTAKTEGVGESPKTMRELRSLLTVLSEFPKDSRTSILDNIVSLLRSVRPDGTGEQNGSSLDVERRNRELSKLESAEGEIRGELEEMQDTAGEIRGDKPRGDAEGKGRGRDSGKRN